MVMEHAGNSALVALSVLVAIFTSFTALNVSGRICVAEASARRWWIVAAAVALGGGTWAMHFVGMLAMSMPASYDTGITLGSLLLPIIASGVGLHVVSRLGASGAPLAWSGLLVGLGIVAMHYTGMAAMRMPGVSVAYDWRLVVASVAIAIAAATGALWLSFRTRDTPQRLLASVVMGGAIFGMHYTGMAAARFVTDSSVSLAPDATMEHITLAFAVTGATTFLLLLALVTAFFHRKLAILTAHEADALQKSEQRYRSLIESASDIIGILDCSGSFIYESSSAWHLLGYRSDEIVGRCLTDFVAPDSLAEAQRFLGMVLELRAGSASVELPLIQKTGERREFEVVARNLLHTATIAGIVVNLRDITERVQLVAQLETLSETDLLTEALNRRGFNRLSERELERLRSTGEKAAIVMFDIDHFKRVNDHYGHAAGDLVLAKVASVCRNGIRAGDLLGRMGGEEFAILLPGDDFTAARAVVQRLKTALSNATVSTISGEVSVTASFGIAYIDPATTNVAEALGRADEGLYEAKNAGRNCIKIRA